MSTGGPDLFVICKSCGSEVSPYITECPYCGNRLRKRAPKLDREGRVAEKRRRRPPAPSLTRLRRDEIPGIRADAHPYATIVLVLLGMVGCLIWRTGSVVGRDRLAVIGPPDSEWWRLLTAPFIYDNTGYAFLALGAIALFGWLIERRYGPVARSARPVGGVGGIAATAAAYRSRSRSAATARRWLSSARGRSRTCCLVRAGEEIDGDCWGRSVIAVTLALLPLAVPRRELGAGWRRGGDRVRDRPAAVPASASI